MNLQQWAPSLTAFSKWLSTQNSTTATLWSRRLNSSQTEQVEGAVAEAVVWDFICCRCEATRLNEAPGSGGVDFEFITGDRNFLVEVTNISTAAASVASGMSDTERSTSFYGLLTRNIRQKVRDKLRQASQQSESPLLVFVTTLHWNASRACVNRTAVEFAMGSPPKITGDFNPTTGEVDGDLYQSTDLSQSVFLSPHSIVGADGSPIAQAKYQPISGFMIGGFGLDAKDVSVLGALNPEALRPFDPTTLADIPFCSFRKWPVTTEVEFDWTISEQDEREQRQQATQKRLRAAGHGDFLDAIRREAQRLPSQHGN